MCYDECNVGKTYLGVVLGTVGLLSTVKSNDLVAEDVLASSKVLGDGDGPCVVLTDHLDSSPLAILVTVGLDLGPLESGLVNRLDITSVGSNVGDNGADVGLGPGGPVELDCSTSGNGGHGVGGELGGTGLVADDVGLAEGVGLDEAVVEVLSVPTDVVGHRLLLLVGVVVGAEPTRSVLAIDGNTVDGAVGHGASGEGSNGSDLGKHIDWLI